MVVLQIIANSFTYLSFQADSQGGGGGDQEVAGDAEAVGGVEDGTRG